MNPKIRRTSSLSDVALCAHLMASSPPWNELFFTEERCLENLSDPSLELHIAEFDGGFVGFMATRATGMEGEPLLEYICVKPQYRSRGVGTRMLEHAEEILFPDANNIYLFVSDINPRAIALYKKIGYEQVGELKNYNLWGQTEYIYRKFRRPRQEQFVPQGSLAKDQYEGYSTGAVDLNSGYAQIPLPKELKDCVLEGTEAAIRGDNDHNLSKSLLQDSLAMVLGLPPRLRGQVRATFSGSIALDRVFSAVGNYIRHQSFPKVGLTAILPEPSLDLWQLLLRERFSRENRDVQIKGVRQQQIEREGSRIDNLIDELETQFRRTPNRQFIVILDSPSNPLGIVTSAEELERLATACGKVGAILIVDHCFLLAGLHAPKTLPSVFHISDGICESIGIWDTGKSIDLAGEKLGFIVPSSARIAKEVDEALAVIQPDTYTARRSVEVFSRLLGSPQLPMYLESVGDICRKNLKYLQTNAHDDWTVMSPEAGTFACVYFEGSDIGSDRLRKRWLEAGVNAAAGKSFFLSTASEGTPFLRVSLVRDVEFFRTAIGRL